MLDEDSAATFTRRALDELHRFGFLGAMLWCYGDYAEPLWTDPPLDEATWERWFGLWRADGSPKPAVAEVTSFKRIGRESPQQGFPLDRHRPEGILHTPLRASMPALPSIL